MPGTVVQVGGGRGFVIEAGTDRYVVTAAHCLTELPEAFGAAGGYAEERTYRNFIGRLGTSPGVAAECVFVDPIADLAVFGEPDHEFDADQTLAYRQLVDRADAFSLGTLPGDDPTTSGAPIATSEAMMLSLDDEWFNCRIVNINASRIIWIEEPAQPIRPGMSGSPIILRDGSAVGVVCVSGDTIGGPNPLLSDGLPAWLVREAY